MQQRAPCTTSSMTERRLTTAGATGVEEGAVVAATCCELLPLDTLGGVVGAGVAVGAVVVVVAWAVAVTEAAVPVEPLSGTAPEEVQLCRDGVPEGPAGPVAKMRFRVEAAELRGTCGSSSNRRRWGDKDEGLRGCLTCSACSACTLSPSGMCHQWEGVLFPVTIIRACLQRVSKYCTPSFRLQRTVNTAARVLPLLAAATLVAARCGLPTPAVEAM